jgi:hypothetical protein
MKMYGDVELWLHLLSSALDMSCQLHGSAALPRAKAPVPVVLEVGWAPELVWTLWRRIPIPPYSGCSLVAVLLKGTRTAIRRPHTTLILMHIYLCSLVQFACVRELTCLAIYRKGQDI